MAKSTLASKMMNRTKTLSITSGKGGVGKTTLVSNIAYGLATQGNRVLVLDGDLGMANVDIFFGVKPEATLLDVLTEEKTISEVIVPIAPQLHLISGGTGLVELNRLNAFERRTIVDAVSSLEYQYDYLIIDTAPGISDNVLYLNSAAQVISVVITPDPASFADSYALIKILNREYKENRFAIICNQVRDELEGASLFQRFNEVVSRFLYVGLDYAGSVPNDALIKRSAQNQRLILKHEPKSEAANALNSLVHKHQRLLENAQDKAGLQFFWEQVVGVA